MSRCPECGHVNCRGRQADRLLQRRITCWACGEVVVQVGPGRPWKTCRKPACLAKRRHYRREGGASLETA